MNSSEILRCAAASMSGPDAYAPKNWEAVCVATTHSFGATGALERANCRLRSGSALCSRGDPSVLAEAKARVCRVVGFPHLDLWEWTKPTWAEVRQAFLEAAV